MEDTFIKIADIDLSHATQMQVLVTDKIIADTCLIIYPYLIGNTIDFINESIQKRCTREEYVFAILNNQDEFVGTCALGQCNFANKTATIGYWIGKSFWNHGYATAACALVVNFAFKSLGLSTIFASCSCDNLASLRVLQKCGFIVTGESKLLLPNWPEPKEMCDFELKNVKF